MRLRPLPQQLFLSRSFLFMGFGYEEYLIALSRLNSYFYYPIYVFCSSIIRNNLSCVPQEMLDFKMQKLHHNEPFIELSSNESCKWKREGKLR